MASLLWQERGRQHTATKKLKGSFISRIVAIWGCSAGPYGGFCCRTNEISSEIRSMPSPWPWNRSMSATSTQQALAAPGRLAPPWSQNLPGCSPECHEPSPFSNDVRDDCCQGTYAHNKPKHHHPCCKPAELPFDHNDLERRH